MAQFRVKFRVKFRVPGSGFQVQGSVLGSPKFWVQNGTHTQRLCAAFPISTLKWGQIGPTSNLRAGGTDLGDRRGGTH